MKRFFNFRDLPHSLLTAGTFSTDSPFRKQVYRVANVSFLIAIVSTLGFYLVCLQIPHPGPRTIPLVAVLLYLISYWIMYRGRPALARSLLLGIASAVIFFGSCYAGRDQWVQVMFFASAAVALMIFDWSEWKHSAFFTLLPLGLFSLCEYTRYTIPGLPRYDGPAVITEIRTVAVAAAAAIVSGTFLYFRTQIRVHQLQIEEYVHRLRAEHHLQMYAHKMASLGEMAAGMAHEINTPLTSISLRAGKLQYLVQHSDLAADSRREMQDQTDRILNTVQRIAKIIASLRAFTHMQNSEPFERANISRIVDETLDLCAQRFSSAGLRLEVDIPKALHAECRPSEISQILLNLLNNAFDAVESWNPSEASGDKWIRIIARERDRRIQIRVSNPGPMIPDELAERLFEPFFTTKRPGKGTGLGLSISRTLLNNHGGSLQWIRSEPFTTFAVEVPISQSAPTTPGLRVGRSEKKVTPEATLTSPGPTST